MPKSIHTEQYKVLREALISARKSAGLSQQDLANRLKKPQSYVAKFEIGERRLDVVEFLQVMQALNIDPCEVIRLVQNYNKSNLQ